MVQTFTKRQEDIICKNLNAFVANFGAVRIEKADYGPGFYVYYPADAETYIQFCENIHYLDGWLYGVVQGFMRGEFKKGSVR